LRNTESGNSLSAYLETTTNLKESPQIMKAENNNPLIKRRRPFSWQKKMFRKGKVEKVSFLRQRQTSVQTNPGEMLNCTFFCKTLYSQINAFSPKIGSMKRAAENLRGTCEQIDDICESSASK